MEDNTKEWLKGMQSQLNSYQDIMDKSMVGLSDEEKKEFKAELDNIDVAEIQKQVFDTLNKIKQGL